MYRFLYKTPRTVIPTLDVIKSPTTNHEGYMFTTPTINEGQKR